MTSGNKCLTYAKATKRNARVEMHGKIIKKFAVFPAAKLIAQQTQRPPIGSWLRVPSTL